MITRRALLPTLLTPLLAHAAPLKGLPRLRVTRLELIPVRATSRTVWLMVRLSTDRGLSGLGEASDAFGFANTTKQDAARMESELARFFALVQGKTPLDVVAYRQLSDPLARAGGLVSATASSAIEQALWDIAGQALDVPIYNLLGGKLRSSLPFYANINRTTQPRTPEGFAATAKRAVAEGFRALKAAPFDNFPAPGSTRAQIDAAVDLGINCMAAMRDAVGPAIELMVDCHSFFDVSLAQSVAKRLEPLNLAWYEEPVAPERTAETLAIHQSIRQKMAGGEVLYGVQGFDALTRAVDVIMPDVKHCGGLLELTHIAALAHSRNVAVAPHNPSGPISTAASVQVCATLPNFRLMELQWGEVAWRGDLLDPPERFDQGSMQIPTRPGLGHRLNDKVARTHPI
jgi:galactonate dehydratase